MSKRMFITVLILVVISISVWQADVSEADVVFDGLISYWTFDEADMDGNIVMDIVGNNNGTIMGNPEIVDGWIGEALQFDGASGSVDCGNDQSLNIGEEDFTLDIWFNGGTQTSDWPCLFRKGNALCDTCDPGYAIYWAGNMWIFALDNSNQAGDQIKVSASSAPYMDETWHHMAGTRDKSDVRLYLDGALAASGASTSRDVSIGTSLVLSFDTIFNGAIDEAKIYNRALSEDEIRSNYEASSRELAVEPASKLAIKWGGIKSECTIK